MNNTELNNIRFEAEPQENKKKLLRSSTNNSIEARGITNNNINNYESRTSNSNINVNNSYFNQTSLEQTSPLKSTFRTPDKGKTKII